MGSLFTVFFVFALLGLILTAVLLIIKKIRRKNGIILLVVLFLCTVVSFALPGTAYNIGYFIGYIEALLNS